MRRPRPATIARISPIVAALGLATGFLSAPARAGDGGIGAPRGVRWIWFPEGNPAAGAPVGTRCLRGRATLPADAKVRSARLVMTADDTCVIHLNGKRAADKRSPWMQVESYDVAALLAPGENVLAVAATNAGAPAGLLGWLDVRLESGARVLAATDGNWKASDRADPGWERADFDDCAWPDAKVLGDVAMGPWGGQLFRLGGGLGLASARKGDAALTADEARELLEADWIYQADDSPTPERSLAEIARARALAARFGRRAGRGGLAAGLAKSLDDLAELDELEPKLRALPPDDDGDAARELYLAVRRAKRAIMLGNPAIDFDKILLVDTPSYGGGPGSPSHAGVHESAHRNGYNYGPHAGSRLVVIEGLRPDAAERVLISPETGYIMRMDLSFDAERIVFGMKPRDGPSFHLYEVGVDGSGLRQLTNSPYDDMDPIYLPDGRIMFSTSRANTYVRCLPDSASTVLARSDADGRNIRIVSRNNEPDYTPSLLPDGRVLYTRWEYTERPLWRLQKLWTVNPDGTGEAVYWGNASAYPDMLWEARAVPGTAKVIFCAVGHHDVMTGCIGMIDVSRGREFPNGIVKVTAEIPWPEVGNPGGPQPVASPDYYPSGRYWSYRCPWPIGPEDFLVSAARRRNGRFDLFLMDIHGNRELVWAGRENSWYAMPLRPREAPPLVPDRVAWPEGDEEPEPGVLFSSNVYHGTKGLPPGKAKYLRVIQMDAKTYSTGFKSWRHSGPVISVIQEDGVKRILGTVPIEPDGSVAFKVPAGRALHFQLLDEDQRCIQLMRSFTGAMPGESRGCLGCHGLHSVSPTVRPGPGKMTALRREPADLTPPPWGAEVSVSFERFCQPILDKYCGRCHQGDGKGRAKLDLTLRGGVREGGISDAALLPFKEPYLTLVGPAWDAPRAAHRGKGFGLAGCLNVERDHHYEPIPPMSMLSSTSPLIKLAMSGEHNDVRIGGEDLLRLIAWVDLNCVYRGDEEVREIPDPGPGIANRFPVPVKIRTAPHVRRLAPVTDPPPPAR